MAKVSESLKKIIRVRAQNCCERCATPIIHNPDGSHNGSFHHRLPQRMGIINTICNLVLLCLTCHTEIHRNEWDAGREGWIAWADPDVTPLLMMRRSWVLLVPDGSLEYLARLEGESLLDWTNGEAFSQSA